ncbi:MAG TPA: hypothetical protein VFP54_07370 [Acidimicrobiales bacterium]|nr:hypothetical protein [Acidimicrobiales bacterium]
MARAGGAKQARRLEEAEATIAAAGYEIAYVDFVEPATVRGPELGRRSSGTDHDGKVVRVRRALKGWKLIEAMEHEAHHLADPSWACGRPPGDHLESARDAPPSP